MPSMQVTKLNSQAEVDLSHLDESQCAAACSEDDNVLISASAGSGKTLTLLTAVAQYRYEHINDVICAITYTRAARAEMEARLQLMGIFDVNVTTIHVWARNLLTHFAAKYDFKIKILEEKEIKEILREVVRTYTLRSKVKSVNIDILYSYVTGNKNMDITDNYRRTLNALEERYIKYKRDNVLYDFTDYPLYLYDVMLTYDEYVNDIDALFVDEFQDVDSIQFETFKRVNSNKKFFIGDGWQSIYVWRGADGEVFEKLDNFAKYKLKYNYRSYQEIINYASLVYEQLINVVNEKDCYISMINWIKPSKISCARGYGGKVILVDPYGEVSEFTGEDNCRVHYDVDYVLDKMIAKTPKILCRTNKQVKAVQSAGIQYDADTVHQAKGLEYDNVIVIDNTIREVEDLNIAYVALTRAKDSVLVINWNQFETYLNRRY